MYMDRQDRCDGLRTLAAAINTALGAATHPDETRCAVAGQRQWVPVVSTRQVTHDGRHAKWGHAATDAIGILPGFSGWLVHDTWASYGRDPGRHGRCNAHYRREIAAIAEQPEQKLSGTFRTAGAADACCRIRGDLSTLRKPAQPLLTSLELTITGDPRCPP